MRIIAFIFALLLASGAHADETKRNGRVQFNSSSTPGVYAPLYTASLGGSVCYALSSTNSDTAAHAVRVQMFNGGVPYGGNSITSEANAGFGTIGPQNLMWGSLQDGNGNAFIQLGAGDSLQATFTNAITAGAVINVTAMCADTGTPASAPVAFTPALTLGGSAAGMTYAAQDGISQQFGNVVIFSIKVALTAKGTSTGLIQITGLPLPSSSGAAGYALAVQANNLATSAATQLQSTVNALDNKISIQRYAAGFATNMTDADLTDTSVIRVTGIYFTP